MTDLEFSGVGVRIRERALLTDITLRLEHGEFIALLGPNGAGKSTLLKAALGLRAATSGSVRLAQRPLAELNARERAAHVAWLPQHIHADEPIRAQDSVAAARFRFHETHAASQKAALSALERVGAGAYSQRPVTELSGGERQRVAFACLVAQEAHTLLFDEPANHLDPAQQVEIYRLIGDLWREGRSIVCITHDVNLLNHLGDAARVRVVGLRAGKLAFETRFDAPELPSQLSALFGLELRTFDASPGRFLVPATRSEP